MTDWRLGYGGDTLNTAIHLARAGHDVAYLTALGSDPLSADLRDEWAAEGLDTSLVLNHPTRSTGLYAINTDDAGERSFSYWRDTSAAREMFALPGMEDALAVAEQADLIVYSLITLAILPPEAREALFALCRRVRARGGKVAFDGNYRPRLWGSVEEARAARDAAIACADIGLPTLEDELLMERDADDPNRRPALDAGLGFHLATVRKPNPVQARGDDARVEAVAAPLDQSRLPRNHRQTRRTRRAPPRRPNPPPARSAAPRRHQRRRRRLQRRLPRRADGRGERGGCGDGRAQAGRLVRDAAGGDTGAGCKRMNFEAALPY